MKITGIKVRQVEVPLVEPFRISLGVITHSRSVIVSVETDEGLVGYGEGAPAILITGESLSGTSDVIREMERDLIGVDPTDLERYTGRWIMLQRIRDVPRMLSIWHVMTFLARKQACRSISFWADTGIILKRI